METTAVLCDVRSVHNVGSIFRTADAAGITKIFLCGITPSPLDRFKKVRSQFAKVALGAESFVAWEKTTFALQCLRRLKKGGYKIVAVEQSSKSEPYSASLKSLNENEAKIALVLGNEVSGLKPAIIKLADHIIEIPMFGRKESLNVAVAFGIVAFEASKYLAQK